ncbi:MAG: riboflavin kinase [bacterium]|nr:riboflavin kinase [bacterium]
MPLPIELHGRVIPGRGRGKGLGMPTANLGQPEALADVPWGVYCGWARVSGQPWQPMLAHWGPVATFGETAPVFEAHLLGYDGALHGKELTVCVERRLRETRPFPSGAALREQLAQDERQAREIFATALPPREDPTYAAAHLATNIAIWRRKPALRAVYTGWYRRISQQLVAGRTLEVGCGIGNFKAFKPDVVATDVHPNSWVDVVADAEALPFDDGAFNNIVGIDMLHHLRRPLRFLREAQRVLSPGGRLVLLEPWITPWSFAVYRLTHEEPVDMRAKPPLTPAEEAAMPVASGEYANQALPTLLFTTYRVAVLAQLPQLRLAHGRYLACLLYPLTGGFSHPTFVPSALVPMLSVVDDACASVVGQWFALRRLVVLEKIRPE